MTASRKTVRNQDEPLKPKALSPFDIITMMFKNPDEFNRIPNEALATNCYIINQIMGIQFPLQAQAFNDWKINQGEVVRYWSQFLHSVGYKWVPPFVYTKGKKKAQEAKDSSSLVVSEKSKREYALKRHVSIKDVNNALSLNRIQAVKDIKEFEKEQKFLSNPNNMFTRTALKNKRKED